ncbi:MAG: hypothetical protein IJD29_05130, partial [Anaerotignum sp.]|nr:hypothetical protein [Anaerotignum sp.]
MAGILPLLLLASTLLHSVQGYFVEERRKELLSQANVISGQLTSARFLFEETGRTDLEEMMLEASQSEDYRIMVLDSSCVVVYDTGYENTGKTFLLPEVIQALQDKDTAREQENGTVYAAASITGAADRRAGVVLIVDDMQDVHDTVGDIGSASYLVLAAVLIVVITIMVAISKVFTEPVKNLIGVIQKMSEGHFEQRVKVNDKIHNEVVDLAIACN